MICPLNFKYLEIFGLVNWSGGAKSSKYASRGRISHPYSHYVDIGVGGIRVDDFRASHFSKCFFFPPLQIERATFKGNSCNTAISVAPVSKYNPLFISHSNPIPAPPKVLPLMLQRVLDSHWRGKLSSRSPFSCPVKKKKILHANQISNISRNKKKKMSFSPLIESSLCYNRIYGCNHQTWSVLMLITRYNTPV